MTRENSGLRVILAFNYGSRQEIVEAAKKFAVRVKAGEVALDSLDADGFGAYLYTKDIPDPDMLVRTSGELRLSNFLLWQLSYAELYFSNKLWPDFKAQDFKDALSEFGRRERRFGG